MNDLSGRGPMGQKVKTKRAPKRQRQGKEDLPYLAEVRALPCCICEAWGMVQLSPTEAHHPNCGRYGNEKAPDGEAIPLCNGHHTGDKDTSKVAIHRGKETWVSLYGSDREWISPTRDKIEARRLI